MKGEEELMNRWRRTKRKLRVDWNTTTTTKTMYLDWCGVPGANVQSAPKRSNRLVVTRATDSALSFRRSVPVDADAVLPQLGGWTGGMFGRQKGISFFFLSMQATGGCTSSPPSLPYPHTPSFLPLPLHPTFRFIFLFLTRLNFHYFPSIVFIHVVVAGLLVFSLILFVASSVMLHAAESAFLNLKWRCRWLMFSALGMVNRTAVVYRKEMYEWIDGRPNGWMKAKANIETAELFVLDVG